MKPLTPKEAVARVMAEGWPSDEIGAERAVSLLVKHGDDLLGARLMVAKEIKRLKPTGAN